MSRFYKEKCLRHNDFWVRKCGRNIIRRPSPKIPSKSVTSVKRQSSLNKRARDTMSGTISPRSFSFNCRVITTVAFWQ